MDTAQLILKCGTLAVLLLGGAPSIFKSAVFPTC